MTAAAVNRARRRRRLPPLPGAPPQASLAMTIAAEGAPDPSLLLGGGL